MRRTDDRPPPRSFSLKPHQRPWQAQKHAAKGTAPGRAQALSEETVRVVATLDCPAAAGNSRPRRPSASPLFAVWGRARGRLDMGQDLVLHS
jgi:hypothetical protein